MSVNKKFIKSDLQKIDALQDSNIDYSDIPELDDSFFSKATVEMPKPKQSITLRVDSDMLSWFKHFGKGYQTKMNAVLRSYYKTHIVK